jgi:hypothetical protein
MCTRSGWKLGVRRWWFYLACCSWG